MCLYRSKGSENFTKLLPFHFHIHLLDKTKLPSLLSCEKKWEPGEIVRNEYFRSIRAVYMYGSYVVIQFICKHEDGSGLEVQNLAQWGNSVHCCHKCRFILWYCSWYSILGDAYLQSWWRFHSTGIASEFCQQLQLFWQLLQWCNMQWCSFIASLQCLLGQYRGLFPDSSIL